MRTIRVNGQDRRVYHFNVSSSGHVTSVVLDKETIYFQFSNPSRQRLSAERVACDWPTKVSAEERLALFEAGLAGLSIQKEFHPDSVWHKSTLEFSNGVAVKGFCRVDAHQYWERQIVLQERVNGAETGAASSVNETILCHVLLEIITKLDPSYRSAPSASLFFTLLCRDGMSQAAMHRKHRWPLKTLRVRKKELEKFLKENFERRLTFKMFSDIFPLFAKAKAQLKNHKAVLLKQRLVEEEERAAEEMDEQERKEEEKREAERRRREEEEMEQEETDE